MWLVHDLTAVSQQSYGIYRFKNMSNYAILWIWFDWFYGSGMEVASIWGRVIRGDRVGGPCNAPTEDCGPRGYNQWLACIMHVCKTLSLASSWAYSPIIWVLSGTIEKYHSLSDFGHWFFLWHAVQWHTLSGVSDIQSLVCSSVWYLSYF